MAWHLRKDPRGPLARPSVPKPPKPPRPPKPPSPPHPPKPPAPPGFQYYWVPDKKGK